MTLNENTINNEINKPKMNQDETTINQFNNFIGNIFSKYQTNIDYYESKQDSLSKHIEGNNNINEYISSLKNQISSLTLDIEQMANYNKDLSSQISKLNIQLQSKDQSIIEMNNKLNYIKDLYTKNETELKCQFDLYKNVIDNFINSQQETLQLFSISNSDVDPSNTLLHVKQQLNIITQFIETIIYDNKTLIELNEQHQITQYESKLRSLNEQLSQYDNNYQTINNENTYLKELISDKEKQIQNLIATQSEMERNSVNEINLLKQKIKELSTEKENFHNKYIIVSECEIGFCVEMDKIENDKVKVHDRMYNENNDKGKNSFQELQITQENNAVQYNVKSKMNKSISYQDVGTQSNININETLNNYNTHNYKSEIDCAQKCLELNKQPLNNLRTKIEMLEKIFKEQETNSLITEN